MFRIALCPEAPGVKTPGSAAATFTLNGVVEATPLYDTTRLTEFAGQHL